MCDHVGHEQEIKLVRTDTTLDLSQKAEKVCSIPGELGGVMLHARQVQGYGFFKMSPREYVRRQFSGQFSAFVCYMDEPLG